MTQARKERWRIAHSESSLGWGGQEHRVLAELIGFKQRGCEVWLLAPLESEVYERARKAGINCVAVRFVRWRFFFNVIWLAIWLKWRRIQILNPHSSQDGWLLGVAGRLAFVPLIVRTRHIDVEYPNRSLSKHAFTTLCDYVLTTSDKITAHFKEWFGVKPDRISTIPTGIDVRRFSPEGPKADLAGIVQSGIPVIGMISVLRSWKGHNTFIQAAEVLREAGFCGHFIIVGDGPGRDTVPEEIAGRKVGEIVTMLGHREDVPELLRALDILVIPSTKHEGVPQIGLQALACKTPVIGSDVGGTPEIIRQGETGRIFPATNAHVLANVIRETLEQRELTREMCERGRIVVEKSHSFEAMLDKLEEIYRRFLK
jgi:glycosyltransferase involved in cell wall biosynthesis